MKYAGYRRYDLEKNPSGSGWLTRFTCPADGCGAKASATSANELGPYDGSCELGHGIYLPYVTKDSLN